MFPSIVIDRVGLYPSMLRISSGKGSGAVPPRLTPALISYSQPCNAALMIVLFLFVCAYSPRLTKASIRVNVYFFISVFI